MRRKITHSGLALIAGTVSACFAPSGTETSPGTTQESSSSTMSTTQTGADPTTGSTGADPTGTPTTGTSTTGTSTTGDASTGDASTGGTTTGTGTTTPPESCSDGLQSGDETDIDCGGSCPPCDADKGCAVDADCLSLACLNDKCLGNPACTVDTPCPPSGIACHANACQAFECVDEPLDAVPCDDGLVCTADGTCAAGTCTPAPTKPVSLLDVVADPALGLHFDGPLQAQNAGLHVALAGDVNGDAILDVMLVSRLTGMTPPRVYVLYGGPTLGLTTLTGVADGDGGFMIEADTGDATITATSLGDFNGDDLGDVLVGTPSNTTKGNRGGAYVVFGKQNGATTVKLNSLGAAGVAINGPNITPSASFGVSVAGLGDLDGDGFNDFAVGAPNDKVANIAVGSVYVVFGSNLQASNTIEQYVMQGAAKRIDGPGGGDFGRVVAPLADFNGDGLFDLAVGQPSWDTSKGRAYVLYLPKPLVSFTVPMILAPEQGLAVNGTLANSKLGGALGPAGDFNGDGRADLVIGTSSTLNKAHIVLGKSNFGGAINADVLVAQNNGFIVSGTQGELFGAAVWGGLDVNDDGKADVVVGAPDFGAQTGRVYVAFGRATPSALDGAALASGAGGFVIEGETTATRTGASVALLPDRDGDGKAEILLGAPLVDPMAIDNGGRVYIVHGGDCKP